MLAKDVMEKEVLTVNETDNIEKVVTILLNNKISGVPVINEENKVVGILTEGDLLKKEKEPHVPSYIEVLGSILYVEGVRKYEDDLKKLISTKVSGLMTKNVITVLEDEKVEKVATIMVENRINRVPVINTEGNLVGIIGRNDLIKLLL